MRDKMFSDGISPKCEYCEFAVISNDNETVLCPKRGVMAKDSCCKKYKYDIIKREPKRIPKMPDYNKSDFEL